jgi:hypothetical protein
MTPQGLCLRGHGRNLMRGIDMSKHTTQSAPNPSGVCQCGCGRLTSLARQTRSNRGDVEGQPVSYVFGHQRRKSPVEYVVDDSGCWVWQLCMSDVGYGQVCVDGKMKGAHRVYYERDNGPIPYGMELDHLCRNRACVNPDHLEAVTHAENMRRGLSTKLTHQDVAVIRERLLSGESPLSISLDFGVHRQTIYSIRIGLSWSA